MGSEQWWKSMIAKHGSEELVREFMRQASNKSKRNAKGTGGFAHMQTHDPERLRKISAEAGKKGKRSATDN